MNIPKHSEVPFEAVSKVDLAKLANEGSSVARLKLPLQSTQAFKSTLQIKVVLERVDLQPRTPKGFKVAPIFEED